VDARIAVAHWRHSRPLASLIPILVVLAASLAACGSTAPSPSPAATATITASLAPAATESPLAPAPVPTPTPGFPAQLTDDEGTAVTIKAEPSRIVSLTPAATETLFALGIGNRVVGKVEDLSLYPPEAADVPDVARYGSVDVEKIVGLGADLVIAGGDNFNPPEAIRKLRDLGVPVLVLFAPDVSTALDDMTLIGRAVGRVDEAAALTTSIEATFEEVGSATANLPVPRVYYELDASNGFFGPAPDYFGTEMIRIAGGDPLTSGTPGVYQIQAEQILAFDPQVILLGDAAYGVTPDQVASRPGWDTVSAVADGAVRPIDDVIVTRPGPRLGEGIRTLAQAIHPELTLPGPGPS
jgi:iron complex transport system substrate-binding protein